MFTVSGLLSDYRSGSRDPLAVAHEVLDLIEAETEPVWISRLAPEVLLAAAAALSHRGDADCLPLYGIPFAVKDNIDVAGLPTTAACRHLDEPAMGSAVVVERLIAAGALFVGKTNMDQFATGLVGTRSPYGALSTVGHPQHISGGSSSGSAVAVARGQVAFSLGTDTAGSGRVPAAFNGLVGCKPTLGLISTRGVLPACASLDCVSIFTHTVADAAIVLEVATGYDGDDPWSRAQRPSLRARRGVLGVPLPAQAELDEPRAERAWEAALERAGGHWEIEQVDIGPLLDAAPLLYDIWIAERAAAIGGLIEQLPDGIDPTVGEIIASGARRSAVDVFDANHTLARLRRAAELIWEQVDALLLPTAPSHPTHADVAAAPISINERLGRYTNFVNLMDLAGLAMPAAERADGLPFGITLLAPAWADQRLLELGAEWLGEAPHELQQPDTIVLAVAGAHMQGLPLSHQLTDWGARPLHRVRTAPNYRFYELPGEGVRRPGLVRVHRGGAAIEVELWEIAPQALGVLVGKVSPPLAIGTVELADGREVTGFVCEGYVVDGATDITSHGGWRAYLDTLTRS
ncbi:MAG TPA: allophanate hydrolase [Solirubrobacteraceae bacterium]|nr:allophanate hydrolase [Solirubrobacteraceae bacterium]